MSSWYYLLFRVRTIVRPRVCTSFVLQATAIPSGSTSVLLSHFTFTMPRSLICRLISTYVCSVTPLFPIHIVAFNCDASFLSMISPPNRAAPLMAAYPAGYDDSALVNSYSCIYSGNQKWWAFSAKCSFPDPRDCNLFSHCNTTRPHYVFPCPVRAIARSILCLWKEDFNSFFCNRTSWSLLSSLSTHLFY